MSWDTFKKNILRLSDNPNAIPTIDTVAKAYATEYDACMKRGGDTINGIPVKQGNIPTMELFFKIALSKGLIQTVGYDIVGEMGQGVIAYWSGAILEKYPVPILPAIGTTVNVSVESNVAIIPGVWKPPLYIPPSTDTKNVIDLFILYAQTHLLTVGGIITTTSLYPPLLTPGPAVINWTGYSVSPAKKDVVLSALPLISDDNDQKPPVTDGINLYSYNKAQANVPDVKEIDLTDLGEIKDNDNEYTTTTYETVGEDPALYIEPDQFKYNPSNASGLTEDYSGYTGGPMKPADSLRKFYLPLLKNVHGDKPKGLILLMAAQTQCEGFFPGSLSFRTNNPGNVGTNGIDIGKFTTLELGIDAQWRKILGPTLSGKSKYYKLSMSLYDYLAVYAPIYAKDKNGNTYRTTNNPTNYTNNVINWFKGQGITGITAQTTLAQLKDLKVGNLSYL